MGDKELDDQGALHVSAPQSTLLQSANGDRLLAAPSRPRAPAGDDDCRKLYRGRCNIGCRGGVGFCLMPFALIISARAAVESIRGPHSSGSPLTSVYLANCHAAR